MGVLDPWRKMHSARMSNFEVLPCVYRVYRGPNQAQQSPFFLVAQGGPAGVQKLEAASMGTIWQQSGDLPEGTAVPSNA